jgi:hypothetical protein
MVRKLIGTTFVMAAALAIVPGGDALADAPAAFGPVAERTFAWKPGTTIEKPTADCNNNADWLLIRGPGVANAKSLDVTPRTPAQWERNSPTTGTCMAPDCVQIYVKVTPQLNTGTYTVALKHADGRTLSTSVDVVANAGRCDYPKGKK